MKYEDCEVAPKPPGTDEGKVNRILEGETRSFPGNASLPQFFQIGFTEKRINPNRGALIEDEKHHTFKELDDISTRLAIVIREFLSGEETLPENPDGDIVIGVCLPPSEKLIFCLFAIHKLGAAYLPFDNSFPHERVTKMVNGSRPVMIISDSHANTLGKFECVSKSTNVITVDQLMILLAKKPPNFCHDDVVEPFPGLPILAERTAIVLYTSGSSGEPKGVRLTHRTIMNRLNWQWRTFPYTDQERCCFKTALTFVDSVPEIFGPLLQGHSIIIFQKAVTTQPNHLIQKISDYKITRMVLVPSLLRAILHTVEVFGVEKARGLLSTVLLWVCSGETLPKRLLLEFFEKFPTGSVLANFYGSTEIMGDVTYETFASTKDVEDKCDGVHVPIGQSIYNTIVYLLDTNMEPVQEGKSGELYIAGYNLASGYVGGAGTDKFLPNPYSPTAGFNVLFRTGDFGRIGKTKSGLRTLYYEGRVDSQIKIRGIRVDLSETEATIQAKSDLVEKVVVLCYHPGAEDQAIIAWVLPKPDVSASRIDMMFKLQFRPFEVPELRILSEIPYLVNGKVDRQRLLSSFESERTNASPFDNWHLMNIPGDSLEATKVFVEVMSQVTGASQHAIVHGLNDSFFNLGGTSLNSITVIMKLKQRNYQIEIGDFISAKSIHEIVSKMKLVTTPSNLSSVGDHAKKVYRCEQLRPEDMDVVAEIIAHSFSHKGDLEVYTHSTYAEFVRLIKSISKPLIEKGYSFIIRRRNKDDKKIVAVALNFDAYDEPENMDASKGIKYVLDFLDFLESKQREKLPKGPGKIWHSFMMGTQEGVDDSENVYITIFMEEENVRLAKQHHFVGIMTTNTNELTQQICTDLHGYEVLQDYQVNQYEAPDGTKPFEVAPDTQRAVVSWKNLKEGDDDQPAPVVPEN